MTRCGKSSPGPSVGPLVKDQCEADLLRSPYLKRARTCKLSLKCSGAVPPRTATPSHTKVSAAKHEAAMAKGARELKGAVIYRQGGKLYMMEEPNNETFRDVFDNF